VVEKVSGMRFPEKLVKIGIEKVGGLRFLKKSSRLRFPEKLVKGKIGADYILTGMPKSFAVSSSLFSQTLPP
jgi:hypothetical protein